jgi:hypothetical protein
MHAKAPRRKNIFRHPHGCLFFIIALISQPLLPEGEEGKLHSINTFFTSLALWERE